MTIAFIVRISNLLPEFLADAFILFRPLQTAGATSPCTLQAIPNSLYHFFIFIQSNCHILSHPFQYIIQSIVKSNTDCLKYSRNIPIPKSDSKEIKKAHPIGCTFFGGVRGI